jgi:hypothetical protein
VVRAPRCRPGRFISVPRVMLHRATGALTAVAGRGTLVLGLPTVRIGVRHGWFWSAVLGAVFGYSAARGSGINSRLLITWLVIAVGISCARLLRFALDEPDWWAAQVSMKGVGTAVWNTIWGAFSFAVIYAVTMAATGILAYGVGRLFLTL